jgi:hypothetical protein
MSDKLREEAEKLQQSRRERFNRTDLMPLWSAALASKRQAALADSATADGGGVLDARTVERGVESSTHGGASTNHEARPPVTADALPETTDWTAAHKTVRVGDAPLEVIEENLAVLEEFEDAARAFGRCPDCNNGVRIAKARKALRAALTARKEGR